MRLRIQYKHCTHIASFLAAVALVGCGTVSKSPTPANEDASARPAARARTASNNIPALPPAGSGRGGYYQDDGPGDDIPEGLLEQPDPEPKVEPYNKWGNRPYVVFGKRYTPITDERSFTQRGIGSWYGKKFHGQKTSSGELYDMYKMTAAHPTLPIPSYARVTNLTNGKQVIVRVNDRGPFHSSRIIDLSFAAALKLDYLGKGSAQVEVERLLPDEIERIASSKREQAAGTQQAAAQPPASSTPSTPAFSAAPVAVESQAVKTVAFTPDTAGPAAAPGFYVQFGAYSQPGNAEAVRNRLMQNWTSTMPPIDVVQTGSLFRVHSGPFASRAEAASAALQLQNAGVSGTTIVQR